MSTTLQSWFAGQFAHHFMIDASPRTHAEYRFTMNAWTRTVGHPDLQTISTLTLSHFRAELARNRTPDTVNKHLRHVAHMLNKAGQPGPRNRDALGLIHTSPWIKPLRTATRLPHPFQLDELQALYEAAGDARLPRLSHCPPATWWKALIVAAYNLGYRRGALLAITDQQVDWTHRTVSCSAIHDKCNADRLKPCNNTTLAHLLTVRRTGLLFPWPHGQAAWYTAWHAILQRALITHRTFHDLKRTCGTQLARFGNPWVVRYMLDHAQTDVTSLYIDPVEQARHLVEQLPQPWDTQRTEEQHG